MKSRPAGGRGRKVRRRFRPEPGWSARTINRELNRFAAQLENDLANGTISTKKEEDEQARLAALEAAKLKTLRQYVEGVFMPTKEVSVSENTRILYRHYLDSQILPALGDFLMGDVTPAMLSKFLLDLQQKDYAYSTVSLIFSILNSLFNSAFQDDTISTNPMLKVKHPAPRKGESLKDENAKAYTVQELRYILQCLDNEPLMWRTFIILLADTGIRKGEACGLQWQDIDWGKMTVTIRRNVQSAPKTGVYLTTPKSGRARVVDIGPDTLNLLKQLRKEQADRAISKFVFTKRNRPDVIGPQTPYRYFKRFERRYGIADFHPHKLRHTSASIALTNGADMVSVSKCLDHSNPAITSRIYAHANEDSIRRAGQAARDALKAEGL